MNDVTTSPAATATTKPERSKIAERDWLGADGQPVEAGDESKAVAARYSLFSAEKFGAENVGKSATFTPKTDDAGTRMLAIMGALTLMGNITNGWIVEKGEKSASPIDDIAARFALITGGEWIDRSANAVGAKVDKDALALAIVQVANAKGKTPDVAVVRAKLDSDATWAKAIRQNPEIAAAYATAVGKTVKSLDDMLADV